MARTIAIASLALAWALLLAPSTSATAQTARIPGGDAVCLPTDARSPVSCGIVRAGQVIRLQVATTVLPTGPIRLAFSEQTATGQAGRAATVTIPPSISRDGGYEVTVPAALCAAARGGTSNFQIQELMSSYNQAETVRRSLGMITIAC